MKYVAAGLLALSLAGCGPGQDPRDLVDPGLESLEILSLAPNVAVPGTTLVIEGRSFVDAPWGRTYLRIDGDLGGKSVDGALLPARFVDFDYLEVDLDQAALDELGGANGIFTGQVSVVVDSAVDGERYATESIDVDIDFRNELQPAVDTVDLPGVVFVNGEATVLGSGFLLGGSEGETVAVIEGTLTAGEGEPMDVSARVPVEPLGSFNREEGKVVIPPQLVGIREARFEGSMLLENAHASGETVFAAEEASLDFDVYETTVVAISPNRASLGQYLYIEGAGFVGDGGTTVRLQGTFTPSEASEPVVIDDLVELVPAFIDGTKLRYVLNNDDLPIDLRRQTGLFEGELIPIVAWEGDEVVGRSANFAFEVAPVKQVVYLNFNNQYVEALREFGLRGVERAIRDRVVEVVNRDYASINLEVRTERPTDFALYAEVEIGGPDPQGLGLLGYDNTPGKDVGNLRLHDRLGGVNAQTQQDGYPGYGGVFVESLFAFSKHPVAGIKSVDAADPLFDEIFDPFRPDRGGQPVRAADLQGKFDDAAPSECPSSSRDHQIRCAVRVLGNLIGTTLSHEIGHSLGLANPYGAGFHNPYDEPNRLMDSGSARPFTERAELGGEGPAMFCDEEYMYLRSILPTDEPDTMIDRPRCF